MNRVQDIQDTIEAMWDKPHDRGAINDRCIEIESYLNEVSEYIHNWKEIADKRHLFLMNILIDERIIIGEEKGRELMGMTAALNQL